MALLSTLADATPARALPFLDMLLALLPRACAAPGSTAAEYFGLLKRLMAPAERRLYLCARGLLGVLSEAIGAEARALRASEATGMVDMSHGCTLRTLVELLQSALELPTALARFKRTEGALPTLLHALLCVRGLVMGKTSFTDECGTRLMALLASLHEASDDDKRAFIAACVRAMEEHAEGRADDGRALLFIFEQICGLVCPEQPEPEYKLTLNKVCLLYTSPSPRD